jgi:hypothetical protein
MSLSHKAALWLVEFAFEAETTDQTTPNGCHEVLVNSTKSLKLKFLLAHGIRSALGTSTQPKPIELKAPIIDQACLRR